MNQGHPPLPPPAASPVTLDNCASEPIHIPGHIQPHGALLALDTTGRVSAWSANLPALLGWTPLLQQALAELPLTDELREALDEVIEQTRVEGHGASAQADALSLDGHELDVVVHGHEAGVVIEFETRAVTAEQVSHFALKAHRGIDRLKRQKSIDALLQLVVTQIRQLTGFDRVMAYRFRHDDSGDVVAEDCIESLEPFIGRRYPASDIPAQARHLYVLNTLRLIADVNYTPVPVLSAPGSASLDMSHCVLRSVSPVHIEYLQNMGVGASMSVSIVVNGRLWGLVACHHMAPLQVPYTLRMACDVIAQVLASSVQGLSAAKRATRIEQAAAVRTGLVNGLLHEEDVLKAFEDVLPALAESLGAHALIVSQAGKLVVQGELPPGLAAQIVKSLPAEPGAPLQRVHRSQWPDNIAAALGPWVGMLGLCFDSAGAGWVLALRREQVETVRWGGRPEKHYAHGPLGPRLTPRGSFDEWRETVRDAAEPWDETHLDIGSQLLSELHRAIASRHAEVERARTQMLAMLGHDLRDPLHSISMAARVLERGGGQQRIGERIRSSSSRMQRLVGQVLDMSRLRTGLGLDVRPQAGDLAQLLHDLVDEARVAHPGAEIQLHAPASLTAEIDADRMAQVLSNLLGNARHHGEPGQPILVQLAAVPEGGVHIQVRNHAPAIPEVLAERLFSPFKPRAAENASHRSGLGMGLYIAHEIVRAHGGALAYAYEAPTVVFTAFLPAAGSAA